MINLFIKRPIFTICLFLLSIVLGLFSLKKIPINLFPNVEFPIIFISTPYPGASPKDVETVTDLIERNLSNLEGLKKIISTSASNGSQITLQFSLSTDLKNAEQQVRQKIFNISKLLPKEIDLPIIQSLNPADQPILFLSLKATVEDERDLTVLGKDLAPYFEKIEGVGEVLTSGGRQREFLIELKEKELKKRNLTASAVLRKLTDLGSNYPLGEITEEGIKKNLRVLGAFESIEDLENILIDFYGNEQSYFIKDIATVKDYTKPIKTAVFVNEKPSVILKIKKRPGSNTLKVIELVEKEMKNVSKNFQQQYKDFDLSIVRNGAKPIKYNIDDVFESILLGILLTIFVVYFFLRNTKSTFITALALPNSLLGSFILMYFAGFSINITTLLALSLAVGLLIDDAIIVRESIFQYLEQGFSPLEASLKGTQAVLLPVIATTLVIISVFAPVAFLDGMIGQFFKEFGLTMCFAMMISFLDAITMAPMLSTYLGSSKIIHKEKKNIFFSFYEKLIHLNLSKPYISIILGIFIFFLSLIPAGFIFKDSFPSMKKISKTFLPTQDIGEFSITFELEKGSTLETSTSFYFTLLNIMKKYPEVHNLIGTIGTYNYANKGDIFVLLKEKRSRKTQEIKNLLRQEFSVFEKEKIYILDQSGATGSTESPFNLYIVGNNLEVLKQETDKILLALKKSTHLEDAQSKFEEGNSEIVFHLKEKESKKLGVTPSLIGRELQIHQEGVVFASLKRNETLFDIKLKVEGSEKNTIKDFYSKFVPNANYRPIPLSSVTTLEEITSSNSITRFNKQRFISLSGNIHAKGGGLNAAIEETKKLLESTLKLPSNVFYTFVGQAEDFQDLQANMGLALLLSIILIFLIISSLYDSFLVSFAILCIIPLALCGGFFALWLTNESLNLFSMIGCIFLIGMAAKNSILLVDEAHKNPDLDIKDAILLACKKRVRPILMTSMTLIAGMIPVAIGLNEASKQRTSLGIIIIGGIISSTLLSFFVIPSCYYYIEKTRRWILLKTNNIF
jgi:HAE1 family hydrophobic/amphiphilic exporter-1